MTAYFTVCFLLLHCVCFAGAFGIHIYNFTNSLGDSATDLKMCCQLTQTMLPMADPGNCPATWGKQIYDRRFIYDDSQVRSLASDGDRRLFRVCLRSRFVQQWIWPGGLQVTNFVSRCCWLINLRLSYLNQNLVPYSWNWNQWVNSGIKYY